MVIEYLYNLTLDTYRITAVLKAETEINASIAASPKGRAAILVLMYVENFKTDGFFLSVTTIVFDITLTNNCQY